MLYVEKLRKGWKMLSNDIISEGVRGKNSNSFLPQMQGHGVQVW